MTLRPHSLIVVAFIAWVASICVVPVLASRSVVAPPPAPVAAAAAQPAEAPVEITDADCMDCHGDPEATADDGHSIAVNASRYATSVHGKEEMSCTTCHADLDGKELPHEDTLEKVDCSTCHEDAVNAYTTSVHATARRDDGKTVGATCVNCHTAHETQPVASGAWRMDMVAECGTCHLDRLKTYKDTFHGKITSLGFERVAKCSDCHGAHAIHPKKDPRSLVSNEKIVATCKQCHADATPGYAQYDPHADKDDAERSPQLYYASRFMHWLLVGTFGFFGLHAMLWLPRSAMERRRHNRAHAESAPTADAAPESAPESAAPESEPQPTAAPKDTEQP